MEFGDAEAFMDDLFSRFEDDPVSGVEAVKFFFMASVGTIIGNTVAHALWEAFKPLEVALDALKGLVSNVILWLKDLILDPVGDKISDLRDLDGDGVVENLRDELAGRKANRAAGRDAGDAGL